MFYLYKYFNIINKLGFYNNSVIIFECFVSLKGGFVEGKNFEGGLNSSSR